MVKFIDSEERGGMGYMDLYTAQCLRVETVGQFMRPINIGELQLRLLSEML